MFRRSENSASRSTCALAQPRSTPSSTCPCTYVLCASSAELASGSSAGVTTRCQRGAGSASASVGAATESGSAHSRSSGVPTGRPVCSRPSCRVGDTASFGMASGRPAEGGCGRTQKVGISPLEATRELPVVDMGPSGGPAQPRAVTKASCGAREQPTGVAPEGSVLPFGSAP